LADENWIEDDWLPCGDAQIGWTYADGIFTAPKPFASWTLIDNEWNAPTAKPNDGKYYSWNESLGIWQERIIT
jgi:hypothetical protein